MALYLISYDIRQENLEDYKPLWDYLEAQHATRILLSQWVLESDSQSAEQDLFGAIGVLLHSGDGLLVSEINRRANYGSLRIPESDFSKLLRVARNT
jgi:hypothetical protein